MKISTKGRYALRTMIDLAMNDTGENISIKAIAARQGISTKYLEQIISTLNKAGYVKSERGANGGYRLTKKPEEYTVGMILRAALQLPPARRTNATFAKDTAAAQPLRFGRK